MAKIPLSSWSINGEQVTGRKGPLNEIRESLNGACKRAGVAHIRVHGLCHTFGSQMGMAGADPFAIMKALGHSDLQMTMHYVSLGKSHIREQLEKLNSIQLLPSERIALHQTRDDLRPAG